MTIREVIQKSAGFLERHGVESPRLQAEHLLGHVLKLPRLKLYLQFDRVLSEAELAPLRELVKRRAGREPLQHILGTANFGGLELKVNRHVLVPRPETELLAERAEEFLRVCSSRRKEAPSSAAQEVSLVTSAATVLDLGTGSGCLPIFLAGKHREARFVAVDSSPEALAVARENAARHAVADRIDFLSGDLFNPLPAGAQFDLIVSNPPYIPTGEIATLQSEVRDFDPHAALDGGADGLDFCRRLAVEAPPFLRADGKLMVEFGDGQAGALKKLFEDHMWIVEAVLDDYSRRARILIARRA
ncbi:MAG TPA: peptide chain release factor N(5)-glutamine methyltransferase [Verrucomicrobiae bacterium]